STTKPSYSVNASSSDIKNIFNMVNKERTSNGLKKYAYRNDLQKAADKRAKEIAEKFSHTRPNGTACFTAIKEAGVSYSTAGENIGQTNGSVSDMMDWWMNSADHKNNILATKFTGIVVGYYQQGNVKYYVQLFVG
ncbi:MAG: CAP domain-containing protein, partial [Eubacterium sp.]|nr:CAP domain-containing protein [Eubacterium sp.]